MAFAIPERFPETGAVPRLLKGVPKSEGTYIGVFRKPKKGDKGGGEEGGGGGRANRAKGAKSTLETQ